MVNLLLLREQLLRLSKELAAILHAQGVCGHAPPCLNFVPCPQPRLGRDPTRSFGLRGVLKGES